MKKYFSCYLDFVRFAAALLVVLDHYVHLHVVSGSAARLMPALGREAVIIFFVLSGFVIAYTTQVKRQTFRQYVIARTLRIYPVALPLLLAAFLLVFISESITGRAIPFDYQIAKAYLYIPFHSLFLGELWTFSEKPLWLESYWSLSYEVWYYVFFAAVFFFRGGKRLFWAAVIFLTIGYKLWLLLPVWYGGVLLWHLQTRLQIGKYVARLGWVLSLLVLCGYKIFGWDDSLRVLGGELWPFPSLPLGSADRYLCDYAVGVMVFLNFYCFAFVEFIFLDKFAAAIKSISSTTFSLYLVHVLVIALWQYFYARDVINAANAAGGGSFSDVLWLTLWIALATVVVSMTTDYFKSGLLRWLTRVYDFFYHAAQLIMPIFRIQK
jgi:peptidoglycan/LPS O-acetylase OafA/YrhL